MYCIPPDKTLILPTWYQIHDQKHYLQKANTLKVPPLCYFYPKQQGSIYLSGIKFTIDYTTYPKPTGSNYLCDIKFTSNNNKRKKVFMQWALYLSLVRHAKVFNSVDNSILSFVCNHENT